MLAVAAAGIWAREVEPATQYVAAGALRERASIHCINAAGPVHGFSRSQPHRHPERQLHVPAQRFDQLARERFGRAPQLVPARLRRESHRCSRSSASSARFAICWTIVADQKLDRFVERNLLKSFQTDR